MEIEGAPKNCDVTRWSQFADIKDIKKEMFKRLEVHFENWLNREPISAGVTRAVEYGEKGEDKFLLLSLSGVLHPPGRVRLHLSAILLICR